MLMLLTMLTSVSAEGFHFTYDDAAYHSSTMIYAKLVNADGDELGGEYTWIGAFIDGVCRGEAVGSITGDGDNDPIYAHYAIRVWGDDVADAGKAITFKVFISAWGGDEGDEYTIPSTVYATFSNEGTVGTPANPFLITLAKAESISLPESITLAKGSQVDMMDYLTVTPADGVLPTLIWDGGNSADYFTMDGSVLTAQNATSEEGAWLGVHDQAYSLNTSTSIKIIEMATGVTWKDEYANGLKVAVGESTTLNDVLNNGYVVEPPGVSLSFDWTSSNTDIIRYNTQMQIPYWEPIAPGMAILTGVARDGSGLTLTLAVTVVQPVTAIYFDGRSMTFEANMDITDILDNLLVISPDNATDKSYHYEIDEKYAAYAVVEEERVKTLKVTDSTVPSVTIFVFADDGYGANGSLDFNIIRQQPKQLEAKSSPLSLSVAENDTDYCTEALINNLALTPAGLDPHDFSPQFTFSNDNVIVQVPDPQTNTYNYKVQAKGEVEVTAVIMAFDSSTGSYNQLETTFKVIARQGVGNFTMAPFNNIALFSQLTIEVTPVPEDADIDVTKLALTVTPDEDQTLPDGWEYGDAAFSQEFNDGRNRYFKFIVNSYSLGKGRLHLFYDNEEYASASLTPFENHSLIEGWQWVSVYSGSLALDDYAMGIKLKDARSQTQVRYRDVYNDKYQFYGDLETFEPLQSYKLYTDINVAAGFNVDPDNSYWVMNAPEGVITVSVRKGWNWIAPPYQYYHALTENLFGNTQFTQGDIMKAKDAFATWDGSQWTGSLHYLKPGEGILFYLQNEGELNFSSEYGMAQQMQPPSQARLNADGYSHLYDVRNAERFDDNMAMIAVVSGVTDNSHCQVWAFVGDECRGQGETIGDRVFITVHGNIGERVTFRVLDSLTGELYNTYGTQTLRALSGSMRAPVCLLTTEPTAIGGVVNHAAKGNCTVTDASGKVVFEGDDADWQPSTNQRGIYMITTTLPSGRRIVRKMIR